MGKFYSLNLLNLKGISLIEILASILLLGILVISFTPLFVYSFGRITMGGEKSIDSFSNKLELEREINSGVSVSGSIVILDAALNTIEVIDVDVFEEGSFQYFASSRNWPDADGFIFNNGEHDGMWGEGFKYGAGIQSKGAQLDLYAANSGDIEEITYVSIKSINFTNVDAIEIDWQNFGDSRNQNRSYLVVSSNPDGDHSEYDEQIAETEDFFRKTSVKDVSHLSGHYYVRIHARDDHHNQERASDLAVYSIKLISSE